MIYDQKENLTQYRGLSENLDRAIAYLEQADFTSLDDGKYPIDGEEVFVTIQTPQTTVREQRRWEAHQTYIDIQFLIEGAERIGVQDVGGLTVSDAYDPQKDIAFYKDNGKGSFVSMIPGSFAVLFPNDAHMPLVCAEKAQPIKKAVLKVKVGK